MEVNFTQLRAAAGLAWASQVQDLFNIGLLSNQTVVRMVKHSRVGAGVKSLIII